MWEAGGESPASILWVAGDDDKGNSENSDDDDGVLLLDNVVDVWGDNDEELWRCEVEPSWVVGIRELRGDRWVREAEGKNPRGDNSLSEPSESLYNGMGCCRSDVWPVHPIHGVLAGVSMVSHGLNCWSRGAEDGRVGRLEVNLCFPVHECCWRPPGAVNAKMHPGWGQGR